MAKQIAEEARAHDWILRLQVLNMFLGAAIYISVYWIKPFNTGFIRHF